MSYVVRTSTQLTSFLHQVGVPVWVAPFCYDSTYIRPTKDWLRRFAEWWQKNCAQSYTRKHDCDNFARKFCVAAQDAHAESANVDAEGLAVGEFCYHSASGPHALCVAVVENDEVVFIEPQTGALVTIPPSQILTCFRVSF